jgi:hypothetical protein
MPNLADVIEVISTVKVEEAVARAVAAERERCAQICQAIADDNNRIALHAAVLAALRCRDAIRKGE